MTPAARLTNEIRNAVSRVGARLFVMTTGRFWAGRVVQKFDKPGRYVFEAQKGDLILRNPRLVNVGFEGLSDLAGYMPVTITQDMVGKTLAVLSCVEVKAGKDRPTPKQLQVIDVVKRAGGRAGVARSIPDALAIVSGHK